MILSRTFRVVLHGSVLLTLAAPMVACNSGTTGDGSDLSDVSVSPADTPAVEGSGPEEPAPQRNDPAFETVGLPVGGSDSSPERDQCVGVSWLGRDDSSLENGVVVKVTHVRLSNKEGFSLKPDLDCPGDAEPCDSFTFTEDDQACQVAVTATASGPDDTGVLLEGQVICPPGQRKSCSDFLANLGRGEARVSYDPEVTDEGPDSSPSSEDPPTPTG